LLFSQGWTAGKRIAVLTLGWYGAPLSVCILRRQPPSSTDVRQKRYGGQGSTMAVRKALWRTGINA